MICAVLDIVFFGSILLVLAGVSFTTMSEAWLLFELDKGNAVHFFQLCDLQLVLVELCFAKLRELTSFCLNLERVKAVPCLNSGLSGSVH